MAGRVGWLSNNGKVVGLLQAVDLLGVGAGQALVEGLSTDVRVCLLQIGVWLLQGGKRLLEGWLLLLLNAAIWLSDCWQILLLQVQSLLLLQYHVLLLQVIQVLVTCLPCNKYPASASLFFSSTSMSPPLIQ